MAIYHPAKWIFCPSGIVVRICSQFRNTPLLLSQECSVESDINWSRVRLCKWLCWTDYRWLLKHLLLFWAWRLSTGHFGSFSQIDSLAYTAPILLVREQGEAKVTADRTECYQVANWKGIYSSQVFWSKLVLNAKATKCFVVLSFDSGDAAYPLHRFLPLKLECRTHPTLSLLRLSDSAQNQNSISDATPRNRSKSNFSIFRTTGLLKLIISV